MAFLLFFICLVASTVGAIVGAGGGVIIKPILDFFGFFSVSTVSFLSGCTVLAMALVSLLISRKSDVKLEVKQSTLLAIGSVIGGIIGKSVFDLLIQHFQNESTVGMIQSIALTIVTVLIFLYVSKKESLPSLHVTSVIPCILIGLLLGFISSFLGIGGGPLNLGVLYFFFSMDAKQAAKNSLYIIIFSQISSLSLTIGRGIVPDFSPIYLLVMIAGGVGGALIGRQCSKHLSNKAVEKLFQGMMIVIILINIYNIFQYMN